MKNVLVAAGVSAKKMSYTMQTISEYCRGKNIDVEVRGRNVYEINKETEIPDVIVILGKNHIETKVPVVSGNEIEAENGVKTVCEEVIRYL